MLLRVADLRFLYHVSYHVLPSLGLPASHSGPAQSSPHGCLQHNGDVLSARFLS